MEISIFDVLGPVMIGPSSSHTAGAAKLARIAREIVAAPFAHVRFALHGSFGETYRGHGTDRALVAGCLGLREDDERLVESFKLAEQQGLGYEFVQANLGNTHENTVRMTFTLEDGIREVTGSSLGGGRILVTNIDGFVTEMSLNSPTVVIIQQDVRGVVSAVASVFAENRINIGAMKVSRSSKGQTACCIIETDEPVPGRVVETLRTLPHIHRAQAVSGL